MYADSQMVLLFLVNGTSYFSGVKMEKFKQNTS